MPEHSNRYPVIGYKCLFSDAMQGLIYQILKWQPGNEIMGIIVSSSSEFIGKNQPQKDTEDTNEVKIILSNNEKITSKSAK